MRWAREERGEEKGGEHTSDEDNLVKQGVLWDSRVRKRHWRGEVVVVVGVVGVVDRRKRMEEGSERKKKERREGGVYISSKIPRGERREGETGRPSESSPFWPFPCSTWYRYLAWYTSYN